MKKCLKFIRRIEDCFVCIVIAVMTVVTFIAAVNRFTIVYPMPWSEELVRILMAWLCFVGAAIGIRLGAHIGINVLTDNLPKRIQKWVIRFTYLMGISCCIILFCGGCHNLIAQAGQRTQAMQISIGWRYACIPLGATLMCVEFLSLLVSSFQNENQQSEGETKGGTEGEC